MSGSFILLNTFILKNKQENTLGPVNKRLKALKILIFNANINFKRITIPYKAKFRITFDFGTNEAARIKKKKIRKLVR